MNVLRVEDVPLAIRRLGKDAGATVASVAALACGIGAALAMWSLLSAVLLKPLPVEAPQRLFRVDPPPPIGGTVGVPPGHAYPVFEAIRDSGTFERIAAGGSQEMLVIEQVDVPLSRDVYFANHNFFATLGISAARGRTFAEAEDRPGALPVAVLSDRYWRNVFNADPTVLGRSVTVSGTPATIIGILPRGFRGLDLSEAPDLYLPLHVAGDIDYDLFDRLDPFGSQYPWIRIVGRLRSSETTAAGAAARLNAVDCPRCESEATRREIGPFVLTNVNTAAVPDIARAGMAHFTILLSITVGLLLLVGCLTVGMLLLVRTEDRRDELAVRLALGATRTRLAAGIAVEAAILCALGAALAVPVAVWLFYGVRAFQLPGGIDIERLELTLGPGTWLVVTGTTLAATCVIALLASLVAMGTAARSPLESRAPATPRVARRAPRTALVAGQVAITLVLVTGAGLFTRSLIEALSLNAGIETDRIFTADIDLEPYGYNKERAAVFVNELRERLQQSGAIESISVTQSAGAAQAGLRVAIDGVQRRLRSGLVYMAIDDEFFSTIGLPIIDGRSFASSDAASAPLTAVVSESLGRLIAGGGDPIGHRISDWGSILRIARGVQEPVYAEVVGVVPDLIVNVNSTEPLAVYHPLSSDALVGLGGTILVLRAAGDPDAAMRETVATVRALDHRVTLEGVLTLDEGIGRQMNPQRFGIHVLGALGGIALLLTVLGTYVIAASIVVRRRRELSIRAALGAGTAQVGCLVLRDTARLVGIGLIAGLVLAGLGARLIRSLLYQVEPLDPIVLVIVSAVILGVALIVSLRPALEATRIDLTRSLREE